MPRAPLFPVVLIYISNVFTGNMIGTRSVLTLNPTAAQQPNTVHCYFEMNDGGGSFDKSACNPS